MTSKKSKTSQEIWTRKFQENWEIDYFFVSVPDGDKPECLLCHEMLSRNKKSNDALNQAGPTRGPRAACGPQRKFLPPARLFRKYIKCGQRP